MSNVDNGQDIMDSRDIIARIEELESERQDLESAVTEAKETLSDAMDDTSALGPEDKEDAQQAVTDAEEALADWDDAEELKALQALAEEAEGCGDWAHGETLIRDSYFQEYAEQLADDMGVIDRNATWPCNCINWERAADELQQDYTSVEYDGVTYWLRS